MTHLPFAGACILVLSVAITFPARGEAQPRTLVSLAPSVTELVSALGFADNLVGRTSACDYPASIRGIDVIGDFGRPNLEAILRLKPDLVIGTAVENPAQLRVLEAAGMTVLTFPCRSWDELMEAAQGVATALGEQGRGGAWIASMEAARRGIVVHAESFLSKGDRPTVFVEVWADPLTTVGRDAFLTECIKTAGGRSISADIRGGYPHVSMEWVVDQDPDTILLFTMNKGMVTAERVGQRPGWGGMRAVRRGQVVADWDSDLFLRPGPRLIEGMELLVDYFGQIAGDE